MVWHQSFPQGVLLSKSLVENPRGDISQEKLCPATFWKMSRPKARNHFGRYPQRHRMCLENAFCDVCLNKNQHTLKDRFPRLFPEFFLGNISQEMAIKQLPDRSLKTLKAFAPTLESFSWQKNYGRKLSNPRILCSNSLVNVL